MRVALLIVLLLIITALPLLAAPARPQYPAPPNANEADMMKTIESFIRATIDNPDSYEPLDWSGLVLYMEDESKAYKWGMRHTYRVGHPQFRVLYVDRIFFIAYNGQVESVVEYNNQPCIDCRWW